MSSPAACKVITARAAAVLTTSEVDATIFTLGKSYGSRLSVDARFTLGSLTNAIFRFYVADANQATWVPYAVGGSVVSWTPTASANQAFLLEAPGFAFAKVSVQGTGTVTSSSATILYRWVTRVI